MKIKTWKAWHDRTDMPERTDRIKNPVIYPSPCRIVPEATWRKVMAVVCEADKYVHNEKGGTWDNVCEASAALREHGRNRK